MNFSFDQNIILENARALLRPLSMDDYDHLVQVATADHDLLQYSPSPLHTPQLFKGYVENALRERSDKFRYAFSIFDKKTNSYAGSSSFANISNYDGRLEIGWTWYGKKFQRSGLNRNCKYLMLSYAFEDLGAERVEFRIDERNTASRNAVEKIGGKFEGVLRSHMLMPNGFRRSTCFYSIIKQEWLPIKQILAKDL